MRLHTMALIIAISATGGSGCQDSSPKAAVVQEFQTPDQLVAAIRVAHRAKDIAGLEKLSYLEGVDSLTRDGVVESFKEMIEREIAQISIEALDPNVELQYSIGSKAYRPNLAPEGRIRISYAEGGATDPTLPLTSTTFLFGKAPSGYRLGFATSADK